MYLLRIPREGVQGEILELLHKIEHGNAFPNVTIEPTTRDAIIACELASCKTILHTTIYAYISRDCTHYELGSRGCSASPASWPEQMQSSTPLGTAYRQHSWVTLTII